MVPCQGCAGCARVRRLGWNSPLLVFLRLGIAFGAYGALRTLGWLP